MPASSYVCLCLFLVLQFSLLTAKTIQNPPKIVCYYNSKSHLRSGQGNFEASDIEPALSYCTHLIYGYAGINDRYKIAPLNEYFDTVQNNYKAVTDLKKNYPNLKVLLSVGGNEDVSDTGREKNPKYKTLIENENHRTTFINSAHTLITSFGFDGLDLAWEFPETKPKKIRTTLGNVWKKVKTKIAGESVIDENAEEHRSQFIQFVREINNFFKDDNLMLTLTVLPNVNSTVYYDPSSLSQYLDFVNLMAYDFYTPQRNPKEADYPAPLYEVDDRKYDENINYQVTYWLQGASGNKIILGVPAYSRSWKMTDDSGTTGIPPVTVDGPGAGGPYINDAGILSFPEVCQLINNPQNVQSGHYKNVVDTTNRKGNYFYHLPDSQGEGIWVGYENTESIAAKANYAKAKGLGGMALDDLSMDDFHSQCGRQKYTLLRTIKSTFQ